MQKKFSITVAGAMLAIPAVAVANVNISGFLKGGVELYKVSGGAAAEYNNELRVSDQASRIILSGSDDIGGGLKGFFTVDTRISVDQGAAGTATGLANGNTGFGLQGGFGKLTLGRWDLHYSESLAIEGNSAGSLQTLRSLDLMSEINGTMIARGTRSSNVIMWDSANMGGVTLRLAYSTQPNGNEGSGKGANGSKDGAMNAVVRYAGGGLAVGGSYWSWKAEGVTDLGDEKSARAWAAYTFPFGLKLGGAYDKSERRFAATESMTKRNAAMVAASFKVGDGTIYANYAKADKLSGPNAGATTANTGAKAYTVGYDHTLSKRYAVGAAVSKLTNETNAAYNFYGAHIGTTNTLTGTQAAAGEDASQVYVGMRLVF
jgi:predicted porin